MPEHLSARVRCWEGGKTAEEDYWGAALTVRGAAPMFLRAEEPEKIFEVFHGHYRGSGRGERLVGGRLKPKNGPMVTANGGRLTARDADPGAKTNSSPLVR